MDAYIQDKIAGIEPLMQRLLAEDPPVTGIEEQCMEALTAPLRPSRYNYLKEVFEEEFPNEYERFSKEGILVYELINLLALCREEFDLNQFGESNEEGRYLRYAVITIIHDYLN